MTAPAKLMWVGVLAGRVRGSVAATTGVETADEVIKYLLAGADTVMTTSSLLRHGVEHMLRPSRGPVEWLDARDLAGVSDIRGKLSHRHVADPTAFERSNYISILQGGPASAERDRCCRALHLPHALDRRMQEALP